MGGLWNQKCCFFIGFGSFLEKRIECGGGLRGPKLVLEAFLKSVDAFFENRNEPLEGLWGKKPLFCLRFRSFLKIGQRLGEVSGAKNGVFHWF